MPNLRSLLGYTILLVGLLLSSAAMAEDFPHQPIRILVGASAGGTTDTMARGIGAEMTKLLGQPVVVENRPGAGGNIAAEIVAKAAPDGHTLLVSYTSHTINATLYPHLPFDPVKDFTPITKALYGAAVKSLKEPQFQDRLKKEGASAVGNTPEEFAAFVRADVQRWAPIVKQSGAKPD